MKKFKVIYLRVSSVAQSFELQEAAAKDILKRLV